MAAPQAYSYRRVTAADEPLVWRMLYEAARMSEEGRMTVETIRFDPYLVCEGLGQAGRFGDCRI
jgi:hypothetical protein